MMESWTRVVVAILGISTLLYHSYYVLQLSCSSNKVADLRERWELVSSQLNSLRRRHGLYLTVVERSPWLVNGFSPQPLPLVVVSYENGPTVEYETVRRRIYSNTKELWYYVRDQLGKALGDNFEGQKRIMASTTEGVAERKRWLVSVQEQLPLTDGREAWRQLEAANVSDLVQRRLLYLQHPPDCREARKVVCQYEVVVLYLMIIIMVILKFWNHWQSSFYLVLHDYNVAKMSLECLNLLGGMRPWGCGFACDIHYLTSCLIYAYATERILVLRNYKWKYYGKEDNQGWAHVFHPLSDNCTEYYNEKCAIPGTVAAELDAKVLCFPVSLYRKNLGHAIPLHYLPQDLGQRIVRFSSDPASWWVGQMLKYMLKPQYHIEKAIDDAAGEINFNSPIVGVHVRRTDKLYIEADFYSLDDYMYKVEDYYARLELTTTVDVRRVYLATDDTNVIMEAMLKYPQYKFYSNYSRAQQARPKTRYAMHALTGLLVDINMLAMCDYVVCTLSSNIARLIYELIHTKHIDVSNRFFSLDFTNYYYRAEPLRRIAVMRNADIAFDIGDEIESIHWNCTRDGTVLKTNITGRIPWYKTEEQLVFYPFPEYEQVPICRDKESD